MMTRKEKYILDAIDGIRQDVYENNMMLRQICQVVNTHLARHHQENEDDFVRNILANLISSGVDISKIIRR
jgi:hypothetical protein